MKTKKSEIIVISLGGSLIAPDKIDVKFLKSFRDLILKFIKKGKKFAIICGGGRTARNYQESAKAIIKLNENDLDWLGIHATRINAHLLRTIFYKWASPVIVKNPIKRVKFKEKILIAAGWKPGFSTDYDAALIAKNLKARKIINLTNIDYVYDKDPKKFKNAKPLKNISWFNFRRLLPLKWSPGLNTPFDPIAAKEAQKNNLEVAVINGKKLKSLENYLSAKNFIGTKIAK